VSPILGVGAIGVQKEEMGILIREIDLSKN
jgi:hypothetical protein